MALRYIVSSNGIPVAKLEYNAYDAVLSVGSTITTGTSITLPASETYNSDELEVYLNGVRLESVEDYNYVASPPRTQIQMTFDLVTGDLLRFRKDLK